MSTPTSCADVRAALAEPLLGTAPPGAASWLLVEHPGPWPSDEHPAGLPIEAIAVIDAATAAGARPQLVLDDLDSTFGVDDARS